MVSPEDRLKIFQTENNVFTKGNLSVAVQLTDIFSKRPFPLNSDDYKTEKE